MKTMTRMFLTIALFFTTFWVIAQPQQNADTILGKWTNEDNTRVIEVIKHGDKYDAVLKKAPDETMIGKNQLVNLVYANGSYKGQVYLPKKDKTLPCTVKLNGNGTMEITAKAGFVSKWQNWKRLL